MGGGSGGTCLDGKCELCPARGTSLMKSVCNENTVSKCHQALAKSEQQAALGTGRAAPGHSAPSRGSLSPMQLSLALGCLQKSPLPTLPKAPPGPAHTSGLLGVCTGRDVVSDKGREQRRRARVPPPLLCPTQNPNVTRPLARSH